MQSSKGLEFRSVIFIGLGQIETSETQAAQNMKLLYVSLPGIAQRRRGTSLPHALPSPITRCSKSPPTAQMLVSRDPND